MTNVVLTTKEELRGLIREELAAIAAPRSDIATEWMDADEVARLVGYSRKYVPELVKKRGLPCHRAGKKLRFRRAEVIAWLEARRYGA